VLAVVTAFFGGLAVGAFVLGPVIETSKRPAVWYAACEILIACWSVILVFAMSSVSTWMLDITGIQPTPAWQWTVAFCGTLLLLLPATAAMGATLPAMERVTAQLRRNGRSIAPLYASNTFGAVAGVLAAAYWLIPGLGLQRTAGLCICLNLLCGLSSLLVFPASIQQQSPRALPRLHDARTAQFLLACTGLLGIGYELLVVRVLSEVTEGTVYTFAVILAVYLIGSAVGAAGYQRWLVNHRDPPRLGDQLLCALASTCLLGTASLWAAEYIRRLTQQAIGTSATGAVTVEALLALIAFGPPTVVMGALFSHLSASAHAAGVSFGRALGVNTLGAAAAPTVCGVLALPLLGAKFALLLIACGYLLLAAWRTWRRPIVWAPAIAMLMLALWTPPLAFVDVPDGGHVVSYQEGTMAAVSVVEAPDGVAVLRINNRQQEGSSATLRVDGRQAWLPLLLHPEPRHALFLGLGTGVTASAAVQFGNLEVDAVELLPEVIAASSHFIQAMSPDGPNPRLNLIAADARRYVKTSNHRYDVIVSDNFHPARSGSGSLYTVEHFEAVRSRLQPGGVFCQWLPLHQLDLATLRSIVRSFMSVYPRGWAMLASNSLDTPVLGLVGQQTEAHFDVIALRARLQSEALHEASARFGIEDEFALLGSFVAGPESLQRFAGNAAANTDDHPVVAYRAPLITYAPDSRPRDRLIALLHELAIDPRELIVRTADEGWPRRLSAYWAARNRFIEAGRDVLPSPDVRQILAQVRQPLLDVLRISADFRPAYDPLVRMARILAQTDAPGANTLMSELAQLQIADPSLKLH
jgi:spermidine synthase